MSAQKTSEGLKRVIGVPAFAATIVNNTIGAGIYALPAIVALKMGSAGIMVYLFCAVMLVAIMMCYVEIGSRITATGGSYIYVETVFGPLAGFIVNCLFFIGWGSVGSAAVINVLGDSLAVLFPVFSNPLPRALLFFCLLTFLVLLNIRGTKQAVRFVEYITIVKLVPLFGIIIFGFSQVKAANLHWEHFPPIKTFGETALVAFFAFAGFETTLSTSGEIENPRRTIPRGIFLGAALVFIIYILLQLVAQGVLGAQMATYKDAPLAAIAERIVGPVGAVLLIIAAVFSCLGLNAGDVLSTPRLLFAGANDGLLPKYLGKVHPKFSTPYLAIITYATLIFIFSVSGGFKSLAVLASGSLLLIYLGVILAMIKLRMRKHTSSEKLFKVPGGLIIPVFSVIAITWMLFQLTGQEAIWTLVFVTGVCLIYLAMQLFKKAG